jgi:hypothetical protein
VASSEGEPANTCPELEALIPSLIGSGYEVTSPFDPDYNCIAWAAEDNGRWWWPGSPEDSYWPFDDASEATLAEFERAFVLLGYEPCGDPTHQSGVTKVALFVGTLGRVTHMARQLPDGAWSSKCGVHKDIRHPRLQDVAAAYGRPAAFLRRVTGEGE